MNYIAIGDWPRREHFAFFQERRNPCLCITARVDAGGLLAFRKRLGRNRPRFTDCVYYAVMKAANAIPEFRMRLVDRQPALFERVDAAFTYVPKGRELHANCLAAYDEAFPVFMKNVQEAREEADARPTLTPPGGESQGLVYLSCLPDIDFTSASNPWGDPWTDTVPRVLAGKADPASGMMPVSVEALHSFVDGRHAAAFFKGLSMVLAEAFSFAGAEKGGRPSPEGPRGALTGP